MRDVILTDRGQNPSDLIRRPSGRMDFCTSLDRWRSIRKRAR